MSFLGILYIFLYLGFGAFQANRVKKLVTNCVNRGHEKIGLTIKPSLGNLFLWKAIYEDKGFYYVDAVRLFTEKEYCEGTKIKKFNNLTDLNDLNKKVSNI